jgi:hypothetical protein
VSCDVFVCVKYLGTHTVMFMFREQSAAQSQDHDGEDTADGIQPVSSFLICCTIF